MYTFALPIMAQSRSEQGQASQSGPAQTLQARASQVPQPVQPVSRQSSVNDNACQLSTEGFSIRSQSKSPVFTPDDKREDAEGLLYTPLWDQACASLRAAQSKHVCVKLKFLIFCVFLLTFVLLVSCRY